MQLPRFTPPFLSPPMISNRGVSLIEVMVSLTLIAIALLGVEASQWMILQQSHANTETLKALIHQELLS